MISKNNLEASIDPIAVALSKKTEMIIPFRESDLRTTVSKRAHDLSNELVDTLVECLPNKLVSDPTYHFGSKLPKENIVNELDKSKNNIHREKMIKLLSRLMKASGELTRSFTASIKFN